MAFPSRDELRQFQTGLPPSVTDDLSAVNEEIAKIGISRAAAHNIMETNDPAHNRAIPPDLTGIPAFFVTIQSQRNLGHVILLQVL
jgi:hypothetical protein